MGPGYFELLVCGRSSANAVDRSDADAPSAETWGATCRNQDLWRFSDSSLSRPVPSLSQRTAKKAWQCDLRARVARGALWTVCAGVDSLGTLGNLGLASGRSAHITVTAVFMPFEGIDERITTTPCGYTTL